jgi:hypothetical protein
MNEEIEISKLDLSYADCRMKSTYSEKKLLSSIREIGIRDPLLGVNANGRHVLLDGFKRYRCAVSLRIEIVPYLSLSDGEAQGIVDLLRTANAKSLTIVEQAKFIDQLKTVQRMSITEIANQLEKSKAWVSVRVDIIKEMGDFVLGRILEGKFPTYAYMYILRQFIRINKTKKEEIDEFVRFTSGKNLSIRDIETLAHGYFKGSEAFRAQIKEGNILWVVDQVKKTISKTADCSEFEQGMLRDLEKVQTSMKRIICKMADKRLKSRSFSAMANLLSEGILEHTDHFFTGIKELYDKTRQA